MSDYIRKADLLEWLKNELGEISLSTSFDYKKKEMSAPLSVLLDAIQSGAFDAPDLSELETENRLLSERNRRLEGEVEELRNQHVEYIRKMAKMLTEKNYEIAEAKKQRNQALEALEQTRIFIGNAYEFGYLRETDEGDMQKMLNRINQTIQSIKGADPNASD